MSLMEFCEVKDGRLVPLYEGTLAPIRCDWCDHLVEPVLSFGALWVCPACFEEAEREWTRTGGFQR